uniref:Uncharacterized protein n=1 Tax=Heterorhabditis bacteriophora TaxID=37862 RepID=A0A1I7WK01_HETBA
MVMLIDVLSFCTLISPRLNHNSFISNNNSKFLNSGHGAIHSLFYNGQRLTKLKFTLQQIVSNFKYLLFDLYYDEFIAKFFESYRKIVFYETSVSFLDLYKKIIRLLYHNKVVWFLKYMSGNCPFSREVSVRYLFSYLLYF